MNLTTTKHRTLGSTSRRLVVVFGFALTLGAFLSASAALAQNYGLDNLYGNVSLGNRPLVSTIGQIINVLLGFLGVLAVGLILYAGFLWMTARGNEEQIGKAKKILTGAVIGLAIIFAAFSVAAYVIKQFSGATNPPGSIVCWDGSTVTPPDTCPQPPGGLGGFQVRGVSPAKYATQVPLCKRVQGRFSDALNTATVNLSTVRVRDTNNTADPGDDVPVTGTFTFASDSFTLSHPQEFVPDRRYEATIVGGASGVRSASNSGLQASYNWYFTTGTESDTTLPRVVSVNPAPGSPEACRAPAIQVMFSEEMDVTTLTADNVAITAGGTPIPVARVARGSDFASMTVYPAGLLPANTLITVTLKSGPGGIADTCGNLLDGDGDGSPNDYTWSFTTGETAECTPRLDTISPPSGYYGETTVVLTGNNLGILGDVLFNGFAADTTSATFPPPPPAPSNLECWGAAACATPIETIRVRVPVGAPVTASAATVVVDLLGGNVSNALSFDLQSPYVRTLSPDQGPVGQFVTVKGANFGATAGVVRFRRTSTGAYFDAELACGVGSWAETQIVVKVPAGLVVGEYEVQVETAAGKRSNLPGFTVNTDTLSPGLCSLVPTCTQNGANPLLTQLTGVRFGATQGTSRVLMSNVAAGSVGTWGDQALQNAQWAATFQDTSHSVQVEAAGRRSNSLDFDIPCIGAPRVIEQQLCSSGTQSPSPWRGSTDACGNAGVSARFTTAMNAATFTHSTPGANIEVRPCTNASCTAFGAPLTFTSLQPIAGLGGTAGFTLTGPAPAFTTGTWYQGTIKQAVTSLAGQPLRSDYTWAWQVQAAACPVSTVQVAEDPTHIREIVPPPPALPTDESKADFSAAAQANNCNVLDPAAYAWSWSFSGNGTPAWVVKESDSNNTAVARAYNYMPNRSQPAKLKAEIVSEGKSDTADVYVDALACRTNQDCVVTGCSAGVSRCVRGSCTPVVSSFTPGDGAPGTWVTLNGCFFGNTQGRVLYQAGQVGVWPNSAICTSTPWTNRQIVSEVPPAAADGTIAVERPGTPPDTATSSASFDVNTTSRPGLCRVAPTAVYESQLDTAAADVTLRGRSFGDPRGSGTVTYYSAVGSPPVYTVTGNAASYGSWSDIAAIATTPAGPGMTSTRRIGVTQDGVESNKMNFTVRAGSPPGGGLPPTITSIDPPNGIAQADVTTIVTIYGTNLVGGRVYFGGTLAPATGCMVTPDALTIEVPPLAATGLPYNVPVTVVTGGGTSNAELFEVNDTIRPGICSINPSFGREGTQVTITGRNFTDNRKPSATVNSFVSVACNPNDYSPSEPGCPMPSASLNMGTPVGTASNRFKLGSTYVTSWSTNQIVVKAPPKVRSGQLRVSVDMATQGLRASNFVQFSGEPFITSLTPASGPAGTWVTVQGGNFGSCPILGTNVSDPCTVSFASDTGRTISETLPAVCRDIWSDSQIVIKAPATGITGLVRVTAASGLRTLPPVSKEFAYTSQPLAPGLCSINPDTINASIPLVTLVGDRFGSDPVSANDKVNWPSSTAPVISNSQWDNQTIVVDVPAGTVSGAVTVQREVTVVTGRTCVGIQVGDTCIGIGWQDVTEQRLMVSNPKQLTVTGASSTATVPMIVPPYLPADGATGVCRNAAIGVTFNSPITLATVSSADFKVTSASCTASAPSRWSWLRRLFSRALPGAQAALPSCAVGGSLRVDTSASTRLTFIPSSPLNPGAVYTVSITSPNVTSPSGVACSAAGSNCKFSFTTGAEVCAIDHVEVAPTEHTFTKADETKVFQARAVTQDGTELSADYAWVTDASGTVLGLSGAAGSSVTATAGSRNGRGRITATADTSIYFSDGRLDPVSGNCPSSYRWYDRNGDGTKNAQECVKQGYLASGSADAEVFLCELPWVLEDDDYNFRLRYCLAEEIKATNPNLAQNSSFGGTSTPSLTDWSMNAGSAWTASAVGDEDASAAAVTQVWNSRLIQTVTGLKQNTTYMARAKVLVDSTIPAALSGGMLLTTSSNCSSGWSQSDQVGRGIGWRQLQVVFNTGANTGYTICLFANGGSGLIGTTFAPAIRFDNVTLQEVAGDLPQLTKSGPLPGSGGDITREYFLKHPSNPDAIALRIYKNDLRLSPRTWYDSRPDIVRGTPQEITVDGYGGVRDGGTSYVAALNYEHPNITSNVYVLGYNRGADAQTTRIYQELLSGWTFNTNPGVPKQELQRDLTRLNHRQSLRQSLDSHAASHGQTIPTLMSGSYLKNRSVSLWDSWQGTLGRDLGATLPLDPLNSFNLPHASLCLESTGFNQSTCWNNTAKQFECPPGSHVYQYESLSPSKVKLSMNMEVKSVTWRGSEEVAIGSDDTCQGTSLTIDYGNPPLMVVRAGAGTGTVTSDIAGINCGGDCTENYDGGTSVVLAASAPTGSIFTGWSGDCTGTAATCTVVMTSNRTVRANFSPIATLQVSPAPTNGSVTGTGISCGSDCSETYARDTTITLTAVPAAGRVLTGWGGACAFAGTTPTCTLTMSGDRTVSATFAQGSTFTVALAGAGTGTVVSAPTGIDCGSDCSRTFVVGTPVTVTAAPVAGSVFTGWVGTTCSGTSTTCTFTPTDASPRSATANFAVGVTVNVTKAGAGTGTVTSVPGGVSCGATCSATYADGTTVTLNHSASAGSTFTGWGGSCSGTGPCNLGAVNSDRAVTATFASLNHVLTVTKVGTGSGTVTSNPAGINCGSDCNETYVGGTSVTLTATAGSGSIFTGWTGACSGSSPSCTVTMDAAKTASATFTASASAVSLNINKAGSGTGTVTSVPAGVDCGTTCAASFGTGTALALTATPAAGAVFAGWSGGGCSGINTCNLTLVSPVTVTATFTPTYTLTVVRAGTGLGTVTSNPAGINCGSDCSQAYGTGTAVTLTALASGGSVFSNWNGGGCSGSNPSCTVSVLATTTVTATFVPGFALTVAKAGTGAATSTVTSNPAGINCGSDCSESYASSTSVTLTAVAGAGYMFLSWSGGSCSGSVSTCTVSMSVARNVTATFDPAYTLNITRAGSGTGTVQAANLAEINCGSDCSHTYAGGASVALTATPNAGSRITSWSGGGCSGTGTTCNATISAATTVTVTFDIIQHAVSVGLAGAGTGTVTSTPAGITCPTDCNQSYPESTPVTLSATPSANSIFAGWSGACTGLSCTLTVDAAKSVTATFVESRTLSLSIAGAGTGSVSSSPAGVSCTSGGACPAAIYVRGTTVVLTASAQAGSVFSSWSGDCAVYGTSPTCTLSLDSNRTTAASFAVAPSYNLSVTPTGTGSVTSSPGGISCGATCTASYLSGTSVTLTAAAGSGFVFGSWGGACSGTSPSCTVAMTAARSVTATFTAVAVSRTVSVSMTGLGAITSSPSGILCGSACSASFADGATVTLTAAALPGYVFQNWGGDCSGTNPTCTLSALAADKTVVANFVVGSSYTVRVNKAGTGSGTVTSNPAGIDCGVSCIASFASGSTVTLTATPAPGSSFAGWSGDCSGLTCSLSLNADKNVTATFNLPAPSTLTLTISGGGTVDASPAPLSGSATCTSGTCTMTFAVGTNVTLTENPDNPLIFAGWSGACSGNSSTCVVNMSLNRSVTATFRTTRFITVSVTGSGTVSSNPIGIVSCATNCVAKFADGYPITLTAAPAAGNVLMSWGGACVGTGPTCTFSPTSDGTVTATFAPGFALTVTKNGTGSGTVTGTGISCGGDCYEPYSPGTVVTLTRVVGAGSTFVGWSGACSGAGATCTVTMSAARTVNAQFNGTIIVPPAD